MRTRLPFGSVAAAVLSLLATDAYADRDHKPRLEVGGSEAVREAVSKSFFVTLDADGEEMSIATAGPLQVFARCAVDVNNEDSIEILARSSVAGWFESTTNGARGAGEEKGVFFSKSGIEQSTYDNSTDKFSAIAPDEVGRLFYIAIDGETVGLGLNVFGHECLAVGSVTLVEIGNRDRHDWWEWRKKRHGDSDD